MAGVGNLMSYIFFDFNLYVIMYESLYNEICAEQRSTWSTPFSLLHGVFHWSAPRNLQNSMEYTMRHYTFNLLKNALYEMEVLTQNISINQNLKSSRL